MESGSESEGSKRFTRFPGSAPPISKAFGDHNLLLPPAIPAPPKGIYGMDDSKERPTGQIGRKPQPQSYSSLDKNSVRYGSSTASFGSPSPAKRDWPNPDSASKGGNEVPGSRRTEERARSRITYHEFMVLDQAGSANIGCDNTRERNLVAIKRLHGVRKGSMRRIQPFTSEHVIAAICKQLVAGLSYIHEELSLCHGELSCGTILLNLDGMVKIANIGESFVRNIYTTAENRHDDVRSIGFVMMELMEPTTYILNPHSAELRSPEKWKDGSGIKGFLSATQHQSLEQLKNHAFLPKEPLAKCLKAHVLCALIAAGTHWDILSLP
ncbi:hypothetical protein DL95DRAFT_449626 [Leptodontidium sp. 2 PMI_412]|nr:hypothetical protein DL95DRAFT_449626 [Leptodontidium sp. 2 PMI_412]